MLMQVVQGSRFGEHCLCCSMDLPPVLNGFIKDQHSGNTHPRHCHCFLSTAFTAARTRIILTEDLIQMRRKWSISADGGHPKSPWGGSSHPCSAPFCMYSTGRRSFLTARLRSADLKCGAIFAFNSPLNSNRKPRAPSSDSREPCTRC